MTEKAFRLGTLESVLKTRLQAKLPELRAVSPVEVTIGHSRDLFADLKAGKFDAVFAIDAPQDPAVQRAKAFAENVMLIYPDSHIPVESQADLEDIPLAALADGCSYRRRVIGWLAEGGVEPVSIDDQPNYGAILDAVAEGRNFAAVPESVYSRSSHKTEIQADRLEGANGKVWVELLWREDAPAGAVERLRNAMGF